jgi:hypothetical protein
LPTFLTFFYFVGGSQLPQQILWNKFPICCAYFTPNAPGLRTIQFLFLLAQPFFAAVSTISTFSFARAMEKAVVPSEEGSSLIIPIYRQNMTDNAQAANDDMQSKEKKLDLIKDYFFDKKKVQLFFTLEFHAAVRGE